jgi:hypothetical protein
MCCCLKGCAHASKIFGIRLCKTLSILAAEGLIPWILLARVPLTLDVLVLNKVATKQNRSNNKTKTKLRQSECRNEAIIQMP